MKNLLVQISLPIKKQLLNSQHSAAVGRQQSIGYELYSFGTGHPIVFEVQC
jgi:hypothetical protein